MSTDVHCNTQLTLKRDTSLARSIDRYIPGPLTEIVSCDVPSARKGGGEQFFKGSQQFVPTYHLRLSLGRLIPILSNEINLLDVP